MTRAKKFEATTYLRTDNLESIADLAHDLDVKAREYARGREGIAVIEVRPAPSISSVIIALEVSSEAPSGAARIARDFLTPMLELMDGGNALEIASRELAYA